MEKIFKPKLIDTLKTYSSKQFTNDLFAGIIVGVVALPLAIAFAIASGVTPEKGLITAIVAGFIIAGLGGSRVQIGGPTGLDHRHFHRGDHVNSDGICKARHYY